MISGATYREGVAYSPDGAMYVTPTGAASITSGTITGTNVPYVLAKWAVPIVFAPTGTMGNNGAATWGTALPNAYTGGFWVVLPAGAIAAGVPAATAIYWAVGATTTTATVYNSTINLANPGAVGTTTAFATTGPGAFTGVTAQTTVALITLPANSLSSTGVLYAEMDFDQTNSAGAKSANFIVGGTDFAPSLNLASVAWMSFRAAIRAGATTGKQFARQLISSSAGAVNTSAVYGAEDLTSQLTIAIKATRGTATDMLVVQGASITVTN